jgi:uncharacterized protein YodC (DUF2158 family)
MTEMKPGDVVQLKSGGPAMTVEKLNETGEWACLWFVAGHDVKRSVFPEVSLQLYDPRSGGNSQAAFR